MTAILDTERVYRYRLERRVGGNDRVCLFVMLNPSTADETQDDPTIRRCMAFARREGCGHLVVCNLYAFRATDPRELRTASDPKGPVNADYLRRAAQQAHVIVAAWGSKHLGGSWPLRVLAMLEAEKPVHALKILKTGHPGHPLYVPADAPLIPYPRRRNGGAV